MIDKTQRDLVMRHLKRIGPLTPLVALREYGIARLASRCWELKQDGVPITKQMVTAWTRNGKTKVAEYRLARAA